MKRFWLLLMACLLLPACALAVTTVPGGITVAAAEGEGEEEGYGEVSIVIK